MWGSIQINISETLSLIGAINQSNLWILTKKSVDALTFLEICWLLYSISDAGIDLFEAQCLICNEKLSSNTDISCTAQTVRHQREVYDVS